MIVLRVPYPLGFYAKGFDGRIDDPNAGWKGRGLWTTSGDRAPWLMEGGKGSQARWPCTSSFGPIRWRIDGSPQTSDTNGPHGTAGRAFLFASVSDRLLSLSDAMGRAAKARHLWRYGRAACTLSNGLLRRAPASQLPLRLK